MSNPFSQIFSKFKQKPVVLPPVINPDSQISQNQQKVSFKVKLLRNKKKLIFFILTLGLLIYLSMNFLAKIVLSSLVSLKLLITVLIIFMVLLIVRLLRPQWINIVVGIIKNRLSIVLNKIKPVFYKLKFFALNWLARFKLATRKEKWLMIRKPLIILIVLFLLFKFGPLFFPPKILTSFPGNKSVEAPLDTRIEIVFNKAVIKSMAEKSFVITPALKGKISWEGNQKLVFTPETKLKRGLTYKAGFNGIILSTYLVPLFGNSQIAFETVGNPKVVIASPKQEAIEDFTAVTVVFDRAMIPLTTATNSAERKPAFTIEPSIKGTGKWLGTTAYQFRPEESYKKGTTYRVNLPSGLIAQDGGYMQNDYSWEFSSQKPHVEYVTPLSGYDYASPVASIAAKFNQLIDPETIKDKFILYDENNNKVAGSLVVNGSMVGFYPSQALIRQKQYRAVLQNGIAGVEGPNGMQDDYSWSFSTTASPAITITSPVSGATKIKEEYSIEVEFKTPMDEDSFEGNITVDPLPDTKPSFSFSSYENHHLLRISTYISRSKKYTVTIGANAKDQYGVALGKPYTFTFTTAPYKPSVSVYPFGTYFGSFTQHLTQRVVAQIINANSINYTLYKLQKEDLMDLYKKHYGQACGGDIECRNWQSYDVSKLTKVNSWTHQFESEKDTPTQVVTKITQSNGQNLPSGFYLLDLKIPQGAHDNMVMIVTKSALTVKTSENQIFTWSVDQASGNSVSDMNIQLMDESGSVLTQGKTNGDGVFKKDVDLFKKGGLFVLGQSDNDTVFAASAWREGIDINDFGLPTYYSANESKSYDTKESYKTFIVLDRPIYRPGQKVYFKGVIRKDNDGAYENVDPNAKVSVQITDEMDRQVFNQEMSVNSFGSFAGDFTLAKGGKLGYYRIKTSYQENNAFQSFQVEEYKKPELLVSVNANKADYIQGETAQVSTNSSYYYGAPVSNNPIKYSIYTQDFNFSWSKNWRFEFGDPDAYWDHPWWYYSGGGYVSQKFLAEGKGVTDSKGNFNFDLPIDISKQSANQQMVIEATIEDKSNQWALSSQTIIVHKSAVYAGIRPLDYSNQANSTASAQIVTIDPKGNEIANIQVGVSFYKRTWTTIREQDPDDGYFYYTSKPNDNLVATSSVTTDAQGYATAPFLPKEGGTYKVVTSVSDSKGNKNMSASFLWVSGQGFQAPRQNNDRIILTTDKPDYFVGDDLSLFVATPFGSASAKTLLTAERGSVLDYKIVDTSETSNNFKMNIASRYTPNTYIGAVLIKPGTKVTDPAEFKIGYTPIKVTDKKKQISVNIQTNNKRYKPGEVLKATIETKDQAGSPVSTEIAVGLVDKAVWDLAMVELPDIYKVFYQPRNLAVETAQLLTMSIDRINANLNLGAKGGSGGGCFSPETKILVKGGVYKQIKDIKVGDIILTRQSEISSEKKDAKVLQVFKHNVDRLLIVNGTLHVTPIHKMYVNGRWTVAGTIIPGDYLLDKNNQQIKVYSVEQIMGKFTVYNLETEKYHTYFAGDIYVHNEKGGFDTSRNNFPDTAYWNPYLKTDANGKAEISIKLPDNLTTWRLAAIANSEKDAFGQNQAEVTVKRDVLIRPFLPRFLSVGDRAKIGAIVANTSGKDQEITIKIETTGIRVNENASQKQSISDGGQAKIFWPTLTQNVSSAKVKLSVFGENGKLLDSVTTTLPVKSFSVPEVVATSGQAKDTALQKIVLPKDVDSTRGQAKLTFSPTLGGASVDSLQYLYDYPYNSIEEIASEIIPSVATYKVFKNVKIDKSGSISQSMLKNAINSQIQILNNQQHADGGWGWFIECGSQPYITAYALKGLQDARNAGFTVDDKTLYDAKTFLQNQLSFGDKGVDLNLQAYIVYVLAESGWGVSSYGANLYERRFELSVEARAYLALALRTRLGMGGNADKLYDELLSLAKLTSTTAHWEEKRTNYYYVGSNITATSAMLEVLMEFDKNSPLIPSVVRHLMNIRRDGYWPSTKDTASAITSIMKQVSLKKDQNLNENYQVLLNGNKLAEGAFTKEDLFSVASLIIPVQKLAIGKENKLTVSKSGQGNLYYNLDLKYYLPFSTINALDQGIIIDREFVDDNGRSLPKDYMQEGAEAWVRLVIVAPAERHFVTIEDILPAGLESVNESLKNVSVLTKNGPAFKNNNNYWYFNHKEYRDDRTTLFAEILPAGVYEVLYRVRATTPGVYHHMPAQAFEAYTPDVSGHSEGGWFEVK